MGQGSCIVTAAAWVIAVAQFNPSLASEFPHAAGAAPPPQKKAFPQAYYSVLIWDFYLKVNLPSL